MVVKFSSLFLAGWNFNREKVYHTLFFTDELTSLQQSGKLTRDCSHGFTAYQFHAFVPLFANERIYEVRRTSWTCLDQLRKLRRMVRYLPESLS